MSKKSKHHKKGANNKSAIKNQNTSVEKRRSLVNEFSINLIFQILSLFVFAIMLSLTFYYMKEKPIVATWFGFATWVVAGLAIAFYVQSWIIAHPKTEAFSVEIPNRMSFDKKGFEVPRFYIKTSEFTISPLDQVVFFNIINLQPHSALITQFTYRMKIGSNPWITLVNVPTSSSIYFVPNPDFGGATEIEPEEMGLDARLRDNSIPSHGVVRGWAFYVIPSDYYTPVGTEVQFQVTIKDAEKNEFTQTFKPETITRWAPTQNQTDLTQRQAFKVSKPGVLFDFSNYKRVYYGQK